MRESLDDSFLDLRTVRRDSTGYVWGVNGQELYPGAKVIEDSTAARLWSERVGIAFHEVLVEANAHALTIIFSELDLTDVAGSYSPYTVGGDDDPAEQYATGSKLPLKP